MIYGVEIGDVVTNRRRPRSGTEVAVVVGIDTKLGVRLFYLKDGQGHARGRVHPSSAFRNNYFRWTSFEGWDIVTMKNCRLEK